MSNTETENHLNGYEYSDAKIFDDKTNATSFFLVSDNASLDRDEQQIIQDVSLIFQVKLPKLLPAITDHRPDEELHMVILDLLNQNEELIVGDIELILWFDNVYSYFSLLLVKEDNITIDIGLYFWLSIIGLAIGIFFRYFYVGIERRNSE